MRRKNKLGQLTFENLISVFTGAEEGKPAAIIEHKVDTPTLVAIGGIAVGTVLLNYLLTKFG